MRVIVTGSTGFIGNRLFNRLKTYQGISELYGISSSRGVYPYRQLGHSDQICEEFYCDITNKEHVEHLMEVVRPHVIFHLAAIAKVKEDQDAPTLITQVNILGTHNLLNYASEGCKFSFASSILARSDNLESIYGATKLASEKYIEIFHKQKRIEGKIFHLCANVGAGSKGIFGDFVKKLRSDNQEFPIIGAKPGSIKPYVFVEDTVTAMIEMTLNDKLPFNIYELTPYDIISCEEIANIMMEVSKIDKQLVWEPEKVWLGDNNKLKPIGVSLGRSLHFKHKYSKDAIVAAAEEVFS